MASWPWLYLFIACHSESLWTCPRLQHVFHSWWQLQLWNYDEQFTIGSAGQTHTSNHRISRCWPPGSHVTHMAKQSKYVIQYKWVLLELKPIQYIYSFIREQTVLCCIMVASVENCCNGNLHFWNKTWYVFFENVVSVLFKIIYLFIFPFSHKVIICCITANCNETWAFIHNHYVMIFSHVVLYFGPKLDV